MHAARVGALHYILVIINIIIIIVIIVVVIYWIAAAAGNVERTVMIYRCRIFVAGIGKRVHILLVEILRRVVVKILAGIRVQDVRAARGPAPNCVRQVLFDSGFGRVRTLGTVAPVNRKSSNNVK